MGVLHHQVGRLQDSHTHDATLQLLECCEDSLRKDLHRSHSNIAMATEIDALTAIKTLAVKAENAMVSRMTLLTITQDREEGVRSFAARLRGQAKICKFTKNCSHNPFEAVNYTDDMVRDALIRGLGDSDIQQDVLGHNDQVTNISAQSVTFLRHKTSLISDLGLASLTKYRTATPSATTWLSARGSGTSLPLPVHLCGLLRIQGLQLHGGCGPLFWLADCAAITRWFFRSCKEPTRNFRYIRHCRRTIVIWRT